MSLIAIDEIEDAFERTKEILFPFDIGTWTRLAIMTLFVGGTGFTGFFGNFPSSLGGTPGSTGGDFSSFESPEAITGMSVADPALGGAAVAGIAVLVLGFVAVFMYLSSVFQFVMFRSVREKEVSIRSYFSDHYYDGFKYTLFLLAYAVVFLAGVAGVIGAFMASPVLGVLLILPAIPVALILAVFGGVVHDFSLQRMIEKEEGLIESIKKGLRESTEDWKEFGGYLIFRLLVSGLIGAVTFFLALIVTLVLAIPFGILAIVGIAVSPILAVPFVLIGLVVWTVLMMYMKVPFQVFLYSYFVELYEEFMG